jgi:hypothetical protein
MKKFIFFFIIGAIALFVFRPDIPIGALAYANTSFGPARVLLREELIEEAVSALESTSTFSSNFYLGSIRGIVTTVQVLSTDSSISLIPLSWEESKEALTHYITGRPTFSLLLSPTRGVISYIRGLERRREASTKSNIEPSVKSIDEILKDLRKDIDFILSDENFFIISFTSNLDSIISDTQRLLPGKALSRDEAREVIIRVLPSIEPK